MVEPTGDQVPLIALLRARVSSNKAIVPAPEVSQAVESLLFESPPLCGRIVEGLGEVHSIPCWMVSPYNPLLL